MDVLRIFVLKELIWHHWQAFLQFEAAWVFFNFTVYKSLWITLDKGTLNKTNVGSVAMYVYVQVVSHSVDHPKLKETSSGGGGTGVNRSKHSPIGMPVYARSHCYISMTQ